MNARISLLGAGSWGTALARLLAVNGHAVTLWGHHPEHIARLASERVNQRYLPGAPFPANLKVEGDLLAAVENHSAVLIVVPSHAFCGLLSKIKGSLAPGVGVAWATKGVDAQSGRLLHEVVRDMLGEGHPLAVLSGPTFANEVASSQPTAMTVASDSEGFAKQWAGWLHNKTFRVYTTDDMIGVQLGGATKNIMAIAAGVADGLRFGANARAALLTRGLAEMMRLGLALGGRAETLMGLAGAGDLILTCTGDQSRNRRFGLGLGKGLSREQITAEIGQEIEGIAAAGLIHRLAQKRGVEMPITEQVFRILNEGLSPEEAVQNLLIREPKSERLVAPDVA